MCYSQPIQGNSELMYTVVLVHKGMHVVQVYVFNVESGAYLDFLFSPLPAHFGVSLSLSDCSLTFRVPLGSDQSPQRATLLHPVFIPIGHCTHVNTAIHIKIPISSFDSLHALFVFSIQHSVSLYLLAYSWLTHTLLCRLLHPGVSAGPFPSLCQHQAAGDALSFPLSLR